MSENEDAVQEEEEEEEQHEEEQNDIAHEINNEYLYTKIENINNGNWSFSPDGFYVTFKVSNHDRKITREELYSINTQLSASKSEKSEEFNNLLTKIQQYHNIIQYLNSQGVLNIDQIKDQPKDTLDIWFDIDFPPIYENAPKADNLTHFVHPSELKKIGNIIQTSEEPFNQLNKYMNSIAGQIIPKTEYESFISSLSMNTLFDSYKLGLQFCNFLLGYHIQKVDLKIESILQSEDESCRSFPARITHTFDEKNLLFIKVKRPVHCYHCILSLGKIISSIKNSENLIFNRKTLIFCQKGGDFVDRIKKIPEKSDTNPDLTYFIIHPELLNEKEHVTLTEFINNRMKLHDSKDVTKVIIVSSIDFREKCSMHKEKIDHCEFKIDDKLLRHFYELSKADENEYNYHLYYSEVAGSGKSTQIRKDNEGNKLIRLFVDASLKFIPDLSGVNFVHFDLSPEIFGENFHVFDFLWTLTVLHSHVYPNGVTNKTPANIFFEVPKLENVVDFSELEFPISVHQAHHISISENFNDIEISDVVKPFCDILFNEEINLTSQLIELAAKMFYPSLKLKKSWIQPRLLKQFISFMEHFCQPLQTDEIDDKELAFFILILRTNFHIWKMEDIFQDDNNMFSSFIIFVRQSLFGSDDDIKWILLSFNSLNVKSKTWNTDILKDEIRDKIGDVRDSDFLENNFFNFLVDNNDVDVYSNQNQQNYINDQAYFFNIIRSVFYQNDQDKSYRKLVDGVLLRKLKQSPNYLRLSNLFGLISYGKNFYNDDSSAFSKYNWNPVFDRLYNIHKYGDYKSELSYLVDKEIFSTDENIIKITNIVLTIDIVKRFVIMLIRIVLNQGVIFEGSTGVGKTTVMKILKTLIDYKKNKKFNWRYHQIDCNCNSTIETLEILNKSFKNTQDMPNQIIFFDHLNTSPTLQYVINEMNQNNTDLPYTVTYIAAVNPYTLSDKFSQSLTLVGLKQPNQENNSIVTLHSLSHIEPSNLVYDVKKLPESALIYAINFDPQIYIFNEEDDELFRKYKAEYLPPEEIHTIKNIIFFAIDSLNNKICKITSKKNHELLKLKKYDNDDIETISNTIEDCKEEIIEDIFSLIIKAYSVIRELTEFNSIFSYRDVRQLMELFSNFLRKLINVFYEKADQDEQNEQPITRDDLVENIIPYSIVLSLMLSIVYKFSKDINIEKNDEGKFALYKKFGMKSDINIRINLIKMLSEVEWDKQIIKPDLDWNVIVKSYSWLKCVKYMYPKTNRKSYNAKLLKTDSLINNLFAISSCYSTSKNSKDYILPCAIIGPSGSSKNLALQLFSKYKQLKAKELIELEKQKMKNVKGKKNTKKKTAEEEIPISRLFYTSYLCTKQSTEESLNASYNDCIDYIKSFNNSFAIFSIENLIIGNLNDKSSIHALHYLMEKGMVNVMPYITTSYSLNYRLMNQSILIYNEIPSDDELAKTFLFSEMESKRYLVDDDKKIELKTNFFGNNGFFSWEKKDGEHKEKYKKFLSKMWKLTINQKRPEFFPLQPVYLIFNSIFHNNKDRTYNSINKLCAYFSSLPGFDAKNSYKNATDLLKKMRNNPYVPEDSIIYDLCSLFVENENLYMHLFEEIFRGPPNSAIFHNLSELILDKKNKYIKALNALIKDKSMNEIKKALEQKQEDDEIYQTLYAAAKCKGNGCIKSLLNLIDINYSILRQKVIDIVNDNGCSLCIKTQNYECLDFIEGLFSRIIERNSGRNKLNVEFHKIFPNNQSVQELLNIVNIAHNSNDIQCVLIIGKFSYADSLLNFFSLSNRKINPILSMNGFSIEIDELPSNVVFCFIENENQVESTDPLLSRLNSIYLDYKSHDEYDMIQDLSDFYNEKLIYSTPHATFVHEYVNRIVSKVNNVKEPVVEDEFAVVFAYKLNNNEIKNDSFEIYDPEQQITWEKKIIVIDFISKMSIKENIDKITDESNDKNYKILYYWTSDFYDYYNENQNIKDNKIPKPEPLDYHYLENDGSINVLFKNNLIEVNDTDHFKTIILTTSPISEELNYESFDKKDFVSKENSIELFDSFFRNTSELHDKLNDIDTNHDIKYIIVRFDKFDNDYDRYIRYLLSKETTIINLIIVYHLNDSQIPEGLITTEEWPVFWIESITNSFLSSCKASSIINCALYDEEETNRPIYLLVLRQIYENISNKYENKIAEDKVSLLLEHIFDQFNSKKLFKPSLLKNLIADLKGKMDKNSYKQVNIKQNFMKRIENKIPTLNHLIEILVLAFHLVNNNDINDTKSFINKFIENRNFSNLFEKSEINIRDYPQFTNTGIYFPELILPLILEIYKIYSEGGRDFPHNIKSSIETLINLQPTANEDTLKNFCNGYFRQYLNKYGITIIDDFDDFISLIK